MTPGPTPSSRENSVKEDPKKRSRSYNGQKTYSGVPEEKYDGASYTSPYWDSYGRKEFSYQGGLGSYNGGDLDRGPLYSDYGGYIYPTERGNGCGGSGGLEPGWRRALSEPGLPVILLVAGAYAVYVLNNAIPTMFRRRKKGARKVKGWMIWWLSVRRPGFEFSRRVFFCLSGPEMFPDWGEWWFLLLG